MIITNKAYKQICEIANSNSNEIGGILGSAKDLTVTDAVADTTNTDKTCKFIYEPNVDYLNEIIEEWCSKNISFVGIFHTHFCGSKSLSSADREYIRIIMNILKTEVDFLYFPIYTLPNQILNVHKAFFENGELIISTDELIIV